MQNIHSTFRVESDDFFGRSKEINLLKKRINGLLEGYRQNVAITGGRLSGKTALLQKIVSEISDQSFVPIYLEVLQEPFEVFAQRYIGTLLYSYFRSTNIDAEEDLDELLLIGARELPATSRLIKKIMSLIKNRDTNGAYHLLLDLTTVIKEETQKSCIVIFDEFHNMDHFKIRNPFANFGKKIMIQKNTMYIVASSKPNAIKKILSEKLSLLFGNFEVINLEGFEDMTTTEYLRAKLGGRRITGGLRNYLMALTGNNPFYLASLIQVINRIADDYRTDQISVAVLIEALEKLLFHEKGLISQYLYNYLNPISHKHNAEIYRRVMIAIALGYREKKEIASFTKISAKNIRQALEFLIDENLIHKCGNFYIVTDPILELWLAQVLYKRETSLVGIVEKMSHDFRNTVEADIRKFLNEDAREVTSRIIDLMKKFSNVMLAIGGKAARLNSFDSVELKKENADSAVLFARNKSISWAVYIAKKTITEDDILLYNECLGNMKKNFTKKIVIVLCDADENAVVTAKSKKMWIWHQNDLNLISQILGEERIIFCSGN